MSEMSSNRGDRLRPASFGRAAALIGVGCLYIASVPWYRQTDPDGTLNLWWGLPDWVAVALACYVGVAILNSIAWLLTDVPDVLPEETRDAKERNARSEGLRR
jgi:hypothetical protein